MTAAAYHWAMLGGGSITLFHVRGIRIAVDWSWFLILFLLIVYLSQVFGDVLDQSATATEPFVYAVLTTVGFFASILLHELGHAVAAQRAGIGITSIQLWIFGGMARMVRETDSPATEFKVAIAGPLVTLAIVVVLLLAGAVSAGFTEFREAAEGTSNAGISGLTAMIAWLASINLVVLVF
ncbi:MAG TPA: site-2 protease family protein, partial [Solirubrobacterales bacterium]